MVEGVKTFVSRRIFEIRAKRKTRAIAIHHGLTQNGVVECKKELMLIKKATIVWKVIKRY